MDYQEDLDKLIIWAGEKGYSVDISTSGDNSVDKESKIISISNKKKIEYQVCVLLHECGHIQIFENGGIISMDKYRNKLKKTSRKNKAATLIEEVEAWRRGLNLAKKLKLSIDDDYIKNNMVNAILKYAKWC